MEVSIVINVAKRAHAYPRGPLGVYTVPAADENGFGMLIVRPDAEIQDVGGKQRRRGEPIPSRKLAEDILGESGAKRGLYICAAEPDLPKALEKAEMDERTFLASNPGELRNKLNPLSKMREFRTAYEPDVKAKLIKLSERVQEEREKFQDACRKLVQPKEIAATEAKLVTYFQGLIKEGDRLWAREATRSEVNEHHREAAIELGYEPPWCYTPGVQVDCPVCGTKVKKGVALCKSCWAVVDDAAARKHKVGPYAPAEKQHPVAAA